MALALQGCTGQDARQSMPPDGDEAVEMWVHPETLSPAVRRPVDFKAESRDVAWGLGAGASSVLRYEPSRGESGTFGLGEPARLAVAENAGVFVFDDSTGMLDLFSPSGQHLRGFDPGLRPSILEVALRPLGLTFGVLTVTDDTIPTLTVVQTDFRGLGADTLLSAGVGPESLRGAAAVGGELVAAPALSGLWVFAKAMSDTVFEVSGAGSSRKLVLPETDPFRAGVLADLQQEILWIVAPRPTGGLGYEAYDISGAGDDGIIDGAAAYLGFRTTPPSFLAKAAFDGSVSGWWRGERGVFVPKGYDMRIEDLRLRADGARVIRDARREANAEEWMRAVESAEEAAQEAEPDGAEDPDEEEEPSGDVEL
jgi:hypothetical protein